MALELVNSGPKMDWTMDTKIYDHYLQWKYSVELIFSSALSKATPAEKSSYIRLWMGPEAMPLLQKWTSTGKIDSLLQKKFQLHKAEPEYPYQMDSSFRHSGIF